MVQVKWTKSALQDLKHIYLYISQDSPRYAEIEINRFLAFSEKLKEFPFLGKKVKELPTCSYREILVGPYKMIYRARDLKSNVYILGLIHCRRKKKLRI